MALSALPLPAPSRDMTDEEFVPAMSAFIAALYILVTEYNLDWPTVAAAAGNAAIAQAAATTAANAAGYASTCSTSVALSTGAKSITLQTGKSFPSAADHVAWLIRASDPTIRIKGKINPYNSGTGAATFTVAASADIFGSGGPYTDWILVSGTFIGAVATAATVRAGADATTPVTVKALSDAAAFQTLTDAATISWDMSQGYNAAITLGGNRTIGAPSNPKYCWPSVLMIAQPASGGPRTLSWDSSYDFGLIGPPTLSTAANAIDVVFLFCINSAQPRYRCSYLKG